MRVTRIRIVTTLITVLAAMGSHAATISDVALIRITSQNNDWLQIAEVIASDVMGNDLALTSAGATTNSSGIGFNGVEANAVNGIAPGFCGGAGVCSPEAPSLGEGIFHSGSNSGAFFEILLASPAEIFNLTIFGRADSFNSRDIYIVELFDINGNSLFLAGDQNAVNDEQRVDVLLNAVPVPAAVWMFASALGLLGWMRKKP
ncbi:MAG: hypothetical protein AB8G18_05185 [Gammaproteobacteria bacterium]